MGTRTPQDVMKEDWLLWPASAIAYIGAIVAVLSAFLHVVRREIVHPLTLIEAATAAVVFLRITFDSRIRGGFNTFSGEYKRVGRATPWKRRFLDPDWGWWAPRYGPRAIRVLRILGLGEAVFAVCAQHTALDDIVFLAMASGAVSFTVGFLYIGLTSGGVGADDSEHIASPGVQVAGPQSSTLGSSMSEVSRPGTLLAIGRRYWYYFLPIWILPIVESLVSFLPGWSTHRELYTSLVNTPAALAAMFVAAVPWQRGLATFRQTAFWTIVAPMVVYFLLAYGLVIATRA